MMDSDLRVHQQREAIIRRVQGESLRETGWSYNVSAATILRLAA